MHHHHISSVSLDIKSTASRKVKSTFFQFHVWQSQRILEMNPMGAFTFIGPQEMTMPSRTRSYTFPMSYLPCFGLAWAMGCIQFRRKCWETLEIFYAITLCSPLMLYWQFRKVLCRQDYAVEGKNEWNWTFGTFAKWESKEMYAASCHRGKRTDFSLLLLLLMKVKWLSM